MTNDTAIRVNDVSKHYLMFHKPEDRLKQMFIPKLQRLFGQPPKQYFVDFAAVNGVSFEVRRGETVGIVGRNGSGKSTLLQMICGTLAPSTGNIEVRGRIAALLELGSGFNPEFTGRENVYLNAAILGLSREETEQRFEQIVAFADIDQFLDQPVKSYSSGMHVRLAFAVAINVDPDILVVDEALAVGDEAFQRKCYARIENIRERGATILLVSHGSQAIIQLCDRAILMDRGEKILEGRPKMVMNHYHKFLNLTGAEAEAMRESIKMTELPTTAEEAHTEEGEATNHQPVATVSDEAFFDPSLVSQSEVEYDSKGGRISNIRILDTIGRQVNCLIQNHKYEFVYDVSFDSAAEPVAFAMFVKSITGVEIAGQQSHPKGHGVKCGAGDTLTVSLPFDCCFLPGTYSCNCGIFVNNKMSQDIIHRKLDALLFRVSPTDGLHPRQGLVDLCPSNRPARIERHRQAPAA